MIDMEDMLPVCDVARHAISSEQVANVAAQGKAEGVVALCKLADAVNVEAGITLGYMIVAVYYGDRAALKKIEDAIGAVCKEINK